jgi:hypothetical protein
MAVEWSASLPIALPRERDPGNHWAFRGKDAVEKNKTCYSSREVNLIHGSFT